MPSLRFVHLRQFEALQALQPMLLWVWPSLRLDKQWHRPAQLHRFHQNAGFDRRYKFASDWGVCLRTGYRFERRKRYTNWRTHDELEESIRIAMGDNRCFIIGSDLWLILALVPHILDLLGSDNLQLHKTQAETPRTVLSHNQVSQQKAAVAGLTIGYGQQSRRGKQRRCRWIK